MRRGSLANTKMNDIDITTDRILEEAADLGLCIAENNDPEAVRLIDSMAEDLEWLRAEIGKR